MVNIIVTGHGNFATGVLSSMKLIAGEQEGVIGVDFIETDSTSDLEGKIKGAIKILSDNILILSDLAGGSPFKTGVMLSQSMEGKTIKVISGTNIGMLLEVALSKDVLNLDELVNLAINAGKDAVSIFEMSVLNSNNDDDFDGI